MKHLVLAIVVGGSLAACAGMPGDSMGGSRSAPVPMVPFTGAPSNTHPMMGDPEAQPSDWWDYTWADSAEQAQRNCQALANQYKVSLTSVQKVGKGKKYQCNFQGQPQ